MSSVLKIASWNINSIRARVEIVEKFLAEECPDILCLQETKVRDADFPEGLFRRLGYNHIIICGQQMHHGVAIASRVPIREDARLDWQANGEARQHDHGGELQRHHEALGDLRRVLRHHLPVEEGLAELTHSARR